MTILHLEHERYAPEAIQKLKKHFDVELFFCESQDALYEKLRDSQFGAIFTRLGVMLDEKCLSLQNNLKYIITPTTGLNHIDLEISKKKGITIISLRGESEFLASIKSTAEHAWALLLSLNRNINQAFESVVSGRWVREPFLCDELDGRKIGIIGYGRLGKIVARYASAFGMTVMVNDLHTDLKHTVDFVSIEKLLQEADVVMLLISWSPENEKFMNKTRFKMMKKGAYFINVSRGELIDEDALLEQLESGRISGAALDVLNHDSAWGNVIEGSFPLINYAKANTNLIITPHIGGYGNHSIIRTRNFVTDKFLNHVNA